MNFLALHLAIGLALQLTAMLTSSTINDKVESLRRRRGTLYACVVVLVVVMAWPLWIGARLFRR